MRKYTLAVVGIVASLSTLTSAAQLNARSLATVAVNLDAATVEHIASQVEESMIGKLNQYFKVQTAAQATPAVAQEEGAESAHHDLPPNVMRVIGKYLKAELETDGAVEAASANQNKAIA